MIKFIKHTLVAIALLGTISMFGSSSTSITHFQPETVSAATVSFHAGSLGVTSFDSHRYIILKATAKGKGWFEFNVTATIKYKNGKTYTVHRSIVGYHSGSQTIASKTTKGGTVTVSGAGHQGKTVLTVSKHTFAF